jgi:hypothetical protein
MTKLPVVTVLAIVRIKDFDQVGLSSLDTIGNILRDGIDLRTDQQSEAYEKHNGN